jgi:hypothetical protein
VNTDWLRALAREVRAWSIPGAKSLDLARAAEEAADDIDALREVATAADDYVEATDVLRETPGWPPGTEQARLRLVAALNTVLLPKSMRPPR